MSIIDWWNELSSIAQIFYCVAVPATLVLLVQTVLMFIGFGQEDGDVDGIDDGLETADAADTEGVFGEGVDHVDSAFEGLEGLRIFTIRGIVAFFVVFGWMGVSLEKVGLPVWLNVVISAVCGFIMMLCLAWLMRLMTKLRSNGNTDNRNTVGTAGKVQLTVPPARTGEGKVHLMLQGAYVERNAVTDDTEAIPTGAEVVVIGVSGQTDLVVKRK